MNPPRCRFHRPKGRAELTDESNGKERNLTPASRKLRWYRRLPIAVPILAFKVLGDDLSVVDAQKEHAFGFWATAGRWNGTTMAEL